MGARSLARLIDSNRRVVDARPLASSRAS